MHGTQQTNTDEQAIIQMNVADFILQRLQAWQVKRIYGYPGDGISLFDAAMDKAQREGTAPLFIRPTHEEIAAFLATADAKFSGEVGVCFSTAGPGAFHMLTGLYDAKMDNQPVVAILGQKESVTLGSDVQQESNLERIFADVAAFVQTIVTPMQAPMVIDKAFRVAIAQQQPCVIIIPRDVQAMPMPALDRTQLVSRSSCVPPTTKIAPPLADIQKMADIINAGKRVALFVGRGGTQDATDDLLKLADLTKAGIVTTLRAKQIIPSDTPGYVQHLGLLGSTAAYKMMEECDTLIFFGTNYPFPNWLPASGQARAVQVDIRSEHLGIRYPTELNIWGDSHAVLSQLLPLIQPKTDTQWRDALSQELQAWDHIIDKFCNLPGNPINARVVYRELNKRLPDNLLITVDGGSTVKWFGQQIRLRRGMQADLSGRLSSMLAAMPYAMAAKFTHPNRPVLCTIGDGAFQMLAMCELITIKRYMAQWPNKQFIIMVLNNSELTEVAWEQRFEDANPMWQDAMQVEAFDYTGYAKLLGFQGIRVDDPAKVAQAWEQAFAHQGVTLLEFCTDPTVYPLAPYVPDDYVQKALQAFEKGDANFPDALNNALAALKLEWVLQNKDPHAPQMNKGRDLPPGV